MTDRLPVRYWAAFVGTAMGQGITLHTSQHAALLEVASSLGVELDENLDDAQIDNILAGWCNRRADDFCVQEVAIP